MRAIASMTFADARCGSRECARAADYGLKLIEAARTNTNAAFNFYGEPMAVKSMAEVIELSTALLRAW